MFEGRKCFGKGRTTEGYRGYRGLTKTEKSNQQTCVSGQADVTRARSSWSDQSGKRAIGIKSISEENAIASDEEPGA
jgi:hypothetical protein